MKFLSFLALLTLTASAEYTYSEDAEEMAQREKPKKKYTPRATGHI